MKLVLLICLSQAFLVAKGSAINSCNSTCEDDTHILTCDSGFKFQSVTNLTVTLFKCAGGNLCKTGECNNSRPSCNETDNNHRAKNITDQCNGKTSCNITFSASDTTGHCTKREGKDYYKEHLCYTCARTEDTTLSTTQSTTAETKSTTTTESATETTTKTTATQSTSTKFWTKTTADVSPTEVNPRTTTETSHTRNTVEVTVTLPDKSSIHSTGDQGSTTDHGLTLSTTMNSTYLDGTTESQDNTGSTTVIWASVICILVVFICIVLVIIFLRRRRMKKTANDKHGLSAYNESDQHNDYNVPDATGHDIKQNGVPATNHIPKDSNVYDKVAEGSDDDVPSDDDESGSWRSTGSDTYVNSTQAQKENTVHGNNSNIDSTELLEEYAKPNKPPKPGLANGAATVATETSTMDVYAKPNKPDKNGNDNTLSNIEMLSTSGLYSLEKEQIETGDVARDAVNTSDFGDDYSYAYVDHPLHNDGLESKDSIANGTASIADDNNRASTLSDIAIFTVENDIYNS